MEPLFEQAIQEHLDLQRRNAPLEGSMPLARYRDGMLGKHAAESTPETQLAEVRSPADDESGWPSSTRETGIYPPEEFWTATPAFDWGE